MPTKAESVEVCARLDADLYAVVVERARAEDRSLASLIRRAVERYCGIAWDEGDR